MRITGEHRVVFCCRDCILSIVYASAYTCSGPSPFQLLEYGGRTAGLTGRRVPIVEAPNLLFQVYISYVYVCFARRVHHSFSLVNNQMEFCIIHEPALLNMSSTTETSLPESQTHHLSIQRVGMEFPSLICAVGIGVKIMMTSRLLCCCFGVREATKQ